MGCVGVGMGVTGVLLLEDHFLVVKLVIYCVGFDWGWGWVCVWGLYVF